MTNTIYDYNDPILNELWSRVQEKPQDCGYTMSLFKQQLLMNIQQEIRNEGRTPLCDKM